MDYDASKDALYHPEFRDTIFKSGVPLPPELMCAELSRLAYIRFENSDADEQRLQAALGSGGLRPAVTFSTRRSSTQGFAVVSTDGQDAFVVFRGTQADDPTDIGTDAEVLLTDWDGSGRVHTGFARALDSVWASVQAWLATRPAGRLWFTGHSLGAALATLAVARAGVQNAALVTFGSPRVGDQAFADSFAARAVKRYVDCCDIVTQVPPEQVLGYRHVSPEAYIDRSGLLHGVGAVSGVDIEIDRASAKLQYLAEHAWRTGEVGSRSLADHAPINYIRALLR